MPGGALKQKTARKERRPSLYDAFQGGSEMIFMLASASQQAASPARPLILLQSFKESPASGKPELVERVCGNAWLP